MLPLLEAIINAIHAIEESGINNGRINIYLEREATQLSFEETQIAPIINIIVEDNGIGFTSYNFDSFQTSNSTFEKVKGGKGIGRFLWLKAFKQVHVDSQFQHQGRYLANAIKLSSFIYHGICTGVGAGNHKGLPLRPPLLRPK